MAQVQRVRAAKGLDGQLVAVAEGGTQDAYLYGGVVFDGRLAAEEYKTKQEATARLRNSKEWLVATLHSMMSSSYGSDHRQIAESVIDDLFPEYGWSRNSEAQDFIEHFGFAQESSPK